MKKYLFEKEQVLIIKDLNIKDKQGNWVQIEFLTGKDKGNKKPAPRERLKDL